MDELDLGNTAEIDQSEKIREKGHCIRAQFPYSLHFVQENQQASLCSLILSF